VPAVATLHPLLLAGGWLVVGLLLAATLTALISVPPLALLTAPPAVVLAHALERRDRGGTVRWTVTIGIAALPLLLAYLNRHGPGTWCHPIGTPRYPGVECADEWDPRPFLAIGLALLLAPAAAIALARRHR
jgi:hypothetical protein